MLQSCTGRSCPTPVAAERLEPRRLLAAGQPDPTFAGDGTSAVRLGLSDLNEVAVRDVLVDAQGRALIGGSVYNLQESSGAPLLARFQGGTTAPALPGDLNVDGSVNGADFSILATSFGRAGTTYHDGDINGDGRVDGADFSILARNFGKRAPQ